MPLIVVPQHTQADLAAWAEWEQQDAAWATTARFRDRPARALDLLRTFRPDYISVSWGKDSTVLAHMAACLSESDGIEVPCVWVRVRGRTTPYSDLVRDAFLARWPIQYHEIECDFGDDAAGDLIIGPGVREAAARFGPRRATGLRGDESAGRRMRIRTGLVVGDSCAPLGWWTDQDVMAYLWAHDLPVHPVYAMSFDGSWPRKSLRTGQVGGSRGDGMGRAEWEARYVLPAMRGDSGQPQPKK